MSCTVPTFCNPPNFDVLFPGLVGPTGPSGAPMAIVSNVAELRALGVAGVPDNSVVQLLGHYAAGDGGSALFYYSSASVASDNGGTVIQPTSGSGRWLYNGTSRVYDVKLFGAVGDGVTVDTAAIQAALDYAKSLYVADGKPVTVAVPPGKYLVSGTLSLTSDGVSIIGRGMRQSIFYRVSDYGNTLNVIGSYGGGNNIQGLGFLTGGVMTSGCHLLTQQLAKSVVSDLAIEGGFGGLQILGCFSMVYDRLYIEGGQNLSGVGTISGTYYLYIPTNGGPSYPSFDVLISNFLFRGGDAAKRIEVGIKIEQCDGIWFSNGHVIGAKKEALINCPITYSANNTTWQQVFFDGQCELHLQLVGAGTVAGTRFIGCIFGGADGTGGSDAVAVNCALLRGLTFEGCEFGSNQASALDLLVGAYIDVKGCRFLDNYLGGTGNVVNIASGCSYVNFTDNTIGYTPSSVGVFVNGATYLTLNNNKFSEVGGVDLVFNVLGTGTSMGGNTTDKTNSIASATALPIPQVGEFFQVTSTTTITSIDNSTNGRKIVLQFMASLTVTNGASLKLAGGVNFSATADDMLTLIYQGGIWYETARSVN